NAAAACAQGKSALGPQRSGAPASPPSPTPTPTLTPTATTVPPTTTPSATPAQQPSFTTAGTASPATVRRGRTEAFTVSVTSANAQTVLVDLEVYGPSGAKV